jgi:hypothetical protein
MECIEVYVSPKRIVIVAEFQPGQRQHPSHHPGRRALKSLAQFVMGKSKNALDQGGAQTGGMK